VRVTIAKNRVGAYMFWLVVALLTALWISNFAASGPTISRLSPSHLSCLWRWRL
jgi:hypothetical protein